MEYDIPEAAHLSLEQMNGVMLGGRNIKVVCSHLFVPITNWYLYTLRRTPITYHQSVIAHPDHRCEGATCLVLVFTK